MKDKKICDLRILKTKDKKKQFREKLSLCSGYVKSEVLCWTSGWNVEQQLNVNTKNWMHSQG